MIEKQFYVRVPEARKILESVEKHIAGYSNAAALTGEQHSIIDQLVMNLMGEITDAAITAMATIQSAILGRIDPDIYRRVGLEQVAAMQATGKSVQSTVPGFVEALRREGVTAFIDKANRKWSLHTYCSMVSRTTSRQAEVAAVLSADPEQDLYKISSHGTTCKICAPLEGRVYSRSGNDPDFPPLSMAFGKIDPNGADNLANTWLNIHPSCLHVLLPWTPAGRTPEEIQKIKDFSSPKKNPITVDPRSQKQIEAYRKKEAARAKWLRNYRQWEKYRITLGDKVPKTYQTFEKHKLANDEKYKDWEKLYRWENKKISFHGVVGQTTATGIKITDISSHVIDQSIARKFTAEGVLDALKNPIKIGKIKIDSQGRQSIQFVGEKAAVVVNPESGNIVTGWRK